MWGVLSPQSVCGPFCSPTGGSDCHILPALQRQQVRLRGDLTSRGCRTRGRGAEPAGEAQLPLRPGVLSRGNTVFVGKPWNLHRDTSPCLLWALGEGARTTAQGQMPRGHIPTRQTWTGSRTGSHDSEGEPCWRGAQPVLHSRREEGRWGSGIADQPRPLTVGRPPFHLMAHLAAQKKPRISQRHKEGVETRLEFRRRKSKRQAEAVKRQTDPENQWMDRKMNRQTRKRRDGRHERTKRRRGGIHRQEGQREAQMGKNQAG